VLYSHRALVVHSLISAVPDSFGLSKSDVVLPVVPMFHVNAWGLPFTATMVGAKQVFPGPHLDPVSILDLLADERVTLTAGVPTVWLAILDQLECNPGKWNLKSLHTMIVGGSAAPQSMIERFEKKHGLRVVHAWGMSEMSPIGTLCKPGPRGTSLPDPEKFRLRATQGTPVPFVDVRAVGDRGEVPWDGNSMGELHVRGPCVARSYFRNPAEADKFTMDGWFRTGDVVTIDPEGYVRITDRSKDLIKSGGEWISSVDVENALMGHPAVKEAAVVAVPHQKWSERPVACVVLKEGAKASDEELRAWLEPRFAKFWLPDAFVFLQQIPRTATGKFLKAALREQLRDFRLPQTDKASC
jgi:fatty-acyl-CoA synthase